MAIITTDSKNYTDIAAAIRGKNGLATQYKPSEMAAAISAIESGGSENGIPKTLEEARNLKIPTAEEIYAQHRPKNWPVLPDPEVNQEIYLCRTIESSGSYCFPILGPGTYKIGYLNENQEFVEALNYNSTSTQFSVYLVTTIPDEILEYYILIYEGNRVPGTISTAPATKEVMYTFLEAKINMTNKKYALGSYYYDNGEYSRFNWWSFQFVKFYGKAADDINVNGLFYNMISLKAFMFDSKENDFLANNTSESLKSVFYYCRSLLCPVEVNNNNNLGNNLRYLMYYSRCPKITIHFPNTEKTDNYQIIMNVEGLKWIDASIKDCNDNYLFDGCNEANIIYSKVISPAQFGPNSKWIYAMFSEVGFENGTTTISMSRPKGELHILPGTKMCNINWSGTPSTSYWTPNTDINVFVDELPVMEESRTFSIAKWMYPLQITDELIAKATEKGYTIALS